MKSPIDLGGGLFLIALATVGFAGTFTLSFGTLSSIGPGLLPRTVSVMIGALGLALVVSSLISRGSPLERWHLRGPLCVLGAALVFAWTIRPLGLIVAGPLAVIVSSLADRQTKFAEITIFAIVMTAVCIGLFSYVLRLPIPVLPTSLPWPLTLVAS